MGGDNRTPRVDTEEIPITTPEVTPVSSVAEALAEMPPEAIEALGYMARMDADNLSDTSESRVSLPKVELVFGDKYAEPITGESSRAEATKVSGNLYAEGVAKDNLTTAQRFTREDIPQHIDYLQGEINNLEYLAGAQAELGSISDDELRLRRLRLEYEVRRLRKLHSEGVEDPKAGGALYIEGEETLPGGGGRIDIDLTTIEDPNLLADVILADLPSVTDEQINNLPQATRAKVSEKLLEIRKRNIEAGKLDVNPNGESDPYDTFSGVTINVDKSLAILLGNKGDQKVGYTDSKTPEYTTMSATDAGEDGDNAIDDESDGDTSSFDAEDYVRKIINTASGGEYDAGAIAEQISGLSYDEFAAVLEQMALQGIPEAIIESPQITGLKNKKFEDEVEIETEEGNQAGAAATTAAGAEPPGSTTTPAATTAAPAGGAGASPAAARAAGAAAAAAAAAAATPPPPTPPTPKEQMNQHFESTVQVREAASALVRKIHDGDITLAEANAYVSGLGTSEQSIFNNMLEPLNQAENFNQTIEDATDVGELIDELGDLIDNDTSLPPVIRDAVKRSLVHRQDALTHNQNLLTQEVALRDAERALAEARVSTEQRRRFMLALRVFGPAILYGLLAGAGVTGIAALAGGGLSSISLIAGGVTALGVGAASGAYRWHTRDMRVRNAEINTAIENIRTLEAQKILEFDNRQAEAQLSAVEGIKGIAESVVQLLATRFPKPKDMSADDYKSVIRQGIAIANTGDLDTALKAVNFALETQKKK